LEAGDLPASFFVLVIALVRSSRGPPQFELHQAIDKQSHGMKKAAGISQRPTGLKIIRNKKPRSPGLGDLTLGAPMLGA
jgi:hypothetical protein